MINLKSITNNHLNLEKHQEQQQNREQQKKSSCIYCQLLIFQVEDEQKINKSYSHELFTKQQGNFQHLRNFSVLGQKSFQKNYIDPKKNQSEALINLVTILKKQNSLYRRNWKMFKQKFQGLISKIHDQLIKNLNNFDYFIEYCPQCQFKETFNMIQYVEKKINLAWTFKSQYKECKECKEWEDERNNLVKELDQVKIRNNELYRANQKLKSFIQERKVYSEKLKAKIKEHKEKFEEIQEKYKVLERNRQTLKEQVKIYQKYLNVMKNQLTEARQKNDLNEKIFQRLASIEINGSLIYRHRNDLIAMIRSLSFKLIKHEKQCRKGEQRLLHEGIEKMLENVIMTKKKSSTQEDQK